VKDRFGVTILPKGDGPDGRHADILGGFQLMVSKTTKNKEAAIELVKFLTSPEIQRVNAATRGYAPTRPDIYADPVVLKADPIFQTLRNVLLEGLVTRPSTAAGTRYDAVSTAYFTAMRRALTGQESAATAERNSTRICGARNNTRLRRPGRHDWVKIVPINTQLHFSFLLSTDTLGLPSVCRRLLLNPF
jgi:trehalose/maltose transport system substrate-binding protein